MLSLFLRNPKSFDIQYATPEYSRFDLIKRRYLEELSKIKDYYRNRDRAVNNRHILARLVNTLAPSIDLDDVEYFKNVSINAPYIAKQFNIVSNIHNGTILESTFYANNSKELFLYVNNIRDPFSFKNNWLDAESVRIIYTENTDLDFHIPFGNKDFREPTLTVFEIDIVAMLMQYKYWCISRLKNGMSTNPNVFVATIVIPNTLNNMLDLTIFNRYLTLYKYGVCKAFAIKHPFNVLDFSSNVDRILLDIIKHTSDKSMPVEQILNIIPTIVNDNMLEALKINSSFFTRQSYWVLWVSRINYISTLLDLLGKKGIARNRLYANILPVEIRLLQNRNTDLYAKLPEGILDNFNTDLDKIKKIVGTR